MLKKLIFPVFEVAEFTPQLQLARLFTNTDFIPVIFFIKPNYQQLTKHVALVEQAGIKFITVDNCKEHRQAPSLNTLKKEKRKTFLSKLKKLSIVRFFQHSIVEILDYLHYKKKFHDLYHKISCIIRNESASGIIVAQTIPGTPLDFILSNCRQNNIKRFMVPFAMFNQDEILEYCLHQPRHHYQNTPLQLILRYLYPQWITIYQGRRLIRRPTGEALALEHLKLVETKPWIPSSAEMDNIAVASEVIKNNFISLGLNKDRIVITGTQEIDRLAQFKHNYAKTFSDVSKELNILSHKLTIAVGWPVNIFPWLGEKKIFWPDYQALSKCWIDILTVLKTHYDINIIITVHPKTTDSEVHCLDEAGFSYLRGQADKLISICDCFITLNGSSITSLAIAASKPVFLFDCYGTNYPEFKNVKGVNISDSEEVFRQNLLEAFADSNSLSRISRDMQSIASSWGETDGESHQRLLALVHKGLQEL